MALNVRNLTNAVTTPVKDALEALWMGVGALLLAVSVMWIFNIWDLRGMVVPIALIGSFLIAMVGFRATNVVGFGMFGAIIGALRDRDVSQGTVTGLTWLADIVIALALAFVMASFTLTVWSFQQAPGAFWILFFGTVLVGLAQAHWRGQTSFTKKLVTGFGIAGMVVALYTTFGGAYTGKVADPETGEPLFMIDPVTRNIDPLNRTPADCRPPKFKKDGKVYEYQHLDNDGKMFDYEKRGTCYSQESPGVRLVPLVGEEARKRNPAAWPAAVGDATREAASAMPLPGFAKNQILWIGLAALAGIAILVWMLARRSRNAASGGTKPVENGWLLGLAAILALIGATVAVTYQVTKDPLPALVKVQFPSINQMEIGRAVATGGYESTYRVTYPPSPGFSRNSPKFGIRWDVCIKVTAPQALPVVPIFERGPAGTVQDIRFSDGTKTALMRYGKLVQEVELTFEFVLAMPGENPCLLIMSKMAG